MHLGYVEIGDIRVDAIDGGAIWMDGGAIFGVVPKPLWTKGTPADDENRVRLSFFSLLVRTGDATVVIEGGSAAHQNAIVRAYHKADEPRLVSTLATLGVEPCDVDFFIPSHLHFDHVGGVSTADSKSLIFPSAKHVFERREWDEARNPVPINRNAYLPGDIAPLESADILLVDKSAQVTPRVRVDWTGGHSFGHQMITVSPATGPSLIFVGDIVPTSEHVSPRWMCAFDTDPVLTYDVKAEILTRAATEGTMIAPGHGGQRPILTVTRDTKGRFIPQRVDSIAPMPQ